MKKIFKSASVIFALLMMPLFVLAQNEIPNPGFENWNSGNPVDWITTNNPVFPIYNVTQSSDAHSGSSSAKMEVVDYMTFAYSALLYSIGPSGGFPVSERYGALNGFVKFIPQEGDFVGATVFMYKDFGLPTQTVIGFGEEDDSIGTSGWEDFSIPIDYISEDIPDGCWIQFWLVNEESNGGVAFIDDLTFGPAETGGCCVGNRGNANSDPLDEANISDITFLINYLFGVPSGPPPVCIEEANANGHPSEDVTISDITFLINYLFGMPSGPPPGPCP